MPGEVPGNHRTATEQPPQQGTKPELSDEVTRAISGISTTSPTPSTCRLAVGRISPSSPCQESQRRRLPGFRGVWPTAATASSALSARLDVLVTQSRACGSRQRAGLRHHWWPGEWCTNLTRASTTSCDELCFRLFSMVCLVLFLRGLRALSISGIGNTQSACKSG